MRLDKLLAHMGYGSRKDVKKLIRKGYVRVNDEVVTDDDMQVNEEIDDIIIFDEEVEYSKNVYIMMNKPQGYICANYSNNEQIIFDLLIDVPYQGLFTVGRLDKDTEGLLLITNDGALCHNLLSYKYHVEKTYYLEYDGEINQNKINKLEEGLEIEDYVTKPAKFKDLGEHKALLTICEGKYHQVKLMMNKVGCEVTFLKRIKFGPLSLDEGLKLGEFRYLTEEEIKVLKSNLKQ